MNIFSLCGIGLLAYAAIQMLGREKSGISLLIGIAGGLCMLAPAVLTLAGLLDEVNAYIESYDFIGVDLLLRGLGLGMCCEITGDILRESGNGGLANALELSCKIAILALSVPLWKNLIEMAGGLFL